MAAAPARSYWRRSWRTSSRYEKWRATSSGPAATVSQGPAPAAAGSGSTDMATPSADPDPDPDSDSDSDSSESESSSAAGRAAVLVFAVLLGFALGFAL